MLTARVLHGAVCAGQYDLDLMFSPDLRGLALRFSQVRAWLCVWLCVCGCACVDSITHLRCCFFAV